MSSSVIGSGRTSKSRSTRRPVAWRGFTSRSTRQNSAGTIGPPTPYPELSMRERSTVWIALAASALAAFAASGCVGDPPGSCAFNVWYPDEDGDGFGLITGGSVTLADVEGDEDVKEPVAIEGSNGVYSCTAPAGYVAKIGDCDDADPELNPDTAWYMDYDGDGYGDPLDVMKSCQ